MHCFTFSLSTDIYIMRGKQNLQKCIHTWSKTCKKSCTKTRHICVCRLFYFLINQIWSHLHHKTIITDASISSTGKRNKRQKKKKTETHMLSSNAYCQHFRHLCINLSVMHKHFHFLEKFRGQHRVPRKKKDAFNLGVWGRTGGGTHNRHIVESFESSILKTTRLPDCNVRVYKIIIVTWQ